MGPAMQSLQARIDSFQKTKRVKRYPGKPSSSTASVKWPHPPSSKANANTLAEAGFFFSPSWDDRDSVSCFLCGKELSDWDAHDDPFEIHYTKCQSSCAWAVVRCGLTEDLDDEGRFVFENKIRLPSGKAMEKARLETFGEDWWPHDGEPGHGATSIKMAQAGFVYTPQAAGDDTVTCLYCNLSLGGWEREDDPLQEHRGRDSKSGAACPFLAFSSKHARSKHVQPSFPVKKSLPVDKAEQQSEDELAVVHITDPPTSRTRRGKARSTASTVPSKPRRKTKATRGKSVKASAPVPLRSPSPSRIVSREQDETATLDASMDVDVSPTGPPAPHPATRSSPLSSESHRDKSPLFMNGSIHSLPNEPASLPVPSSPSKVITSPDTTLSHPDPIVLLSSTGQSTIANSQLLTDHERTMSLEQWIRQEISLGHERLLTDGRRQIELFKTKAAELRKCIDEL